MKNVILFAADINSSVYVDHKGKDTLIFVERPTSRLDDMTLTTEGKYPINFTQLGKRFVLSLNYNGSNSFCFLMLQTYINSKQTLRNKGLCSVFK